MFGDDPFEKRQKRFSFMRALLIAPDAVLAPIWKRVLSEESFETVVVPDGVAALRLASTHGFDLIIVAGDLGVVGLGEFLSLLHRGVFGPSPPPIIIQRPDPIGKAPVEERPFSGCVVVGALNEHDFPDAIDRAFALRHADNNINGGYHA